MTTPSPLPDPPALLAQDPMALALAAAAEAAGMGEVPVGAVVWDPVGQAPVAIAGNRTQASSDVTAHAEMLALRAAARFWGSPRLVGLDLYVTLEPCAMCAGAIAAARLRRLYAGALDPKSGGVWHGARVLDQPQAHHRVALVHGLGASEARALLQAFFAARRPGE